MFCEKAPWLLLLLLLRFSAYFVLVHWCTSLFACANVCACVCQCVSVWLCMCAVSFVQAHWAVNFMSQQHFVYVAVALALVVVVVFVVPAAAAAAALLCWWWNLAMRCGRQRKPTERMLMLALVVNYQSGRLPLLLPLAKGFHVHFIHTHTQILTHTVMHTKWQTSCSSARSATCICICIRISIALSVSHSPSLSHTHTHKQIELLNWVTWICNFSNAALGPSSYAANEKSTTSQHR